MNKANLFSMMILPLVLQKRKGGIMKKLFVVPLFVLGTVLSLSAQAIDTSTGLVLYFSFDTTRDGFALAIKDLSNNKNTGILHGQQLELISTGYSVYYDKTIKNNSQAISFRPNYTTSLPSSYLEVVPVAGFKQDCDFTISLWYCTFPLYLQFEKLLHLVGSEPTIGPASSVNIGLVNTSDSQVVNVGFCASNGTPTGKYFSLSYKIPGHFYYSYFHHVALVRNKTTFKLFVDSNERDTIVSGITINLGSYLSLGAYQNAVFTGFYDNVKIYNRALSNDELFYYNKKTSLSPGTCQNIANFQHGNQRPYSTYNLMGRAIEEKVRVPGAYTSKNGKKIYIKEK
jgi:hypothetical protein